MGKGIPLPAEVTWQVQLLGWSALIIVSLLGGAVLWFLKRYIDQNDKHHADVNTKLEKNSSAVKDLTTKIENETLKIERAASDMKQAQAEFSMKVNAELLEIHKSASAIKADLTEGFSKVALVKKDLEQLSEHVARQQRTLSLGAQALTKQGEAVKTMQTEVIRLGKELILVKGKNT